MVTSNGSSHPIPPWLSASNPASSPSVTLSLASSNVGPGGSLSSPIPWLNHQQQQVVVGPPEGLLVTELAECCRELEEGHRVWAAHRKEAAWRLSRVELQMESEKACRRREKMEEVEAKVKALREEQQAALERIEADYREQLAGLRRDAEAKEQKLAEQWAAKHARLTKFLDQMGCRAPRMTEPNGR